MTVTNSEENHDDPFVETSQAEPSSSPEPAQPRPDGKSTALVGRSIRRSFRIGDRRLEVLHGVNIEVQRGELVGLMGSSGAGKTTLLNILGLLDAPTEGQVLLDGVDGWGLTPGERAEFRNQKIGFVFQFYHLLSELTALENCLLPAMIAHKGSRYRSLRRKYTDKASEMLVRFGLAERLDHRPSELSGGEQQRVAIARALLLDPSVLIADEPTGNLDRGTGEKVLELLFQEQRARDLSMLLVTHDERLATRCERVVYMEDGLIQADTATPIPH